MEHAAHLGSIRIETWFFSPLEPLGIFPPPSVSVTHMPLVCTVGKIDDERMRVKLACGVMGGNQSFFTRGKIAVGYQEVCGLNARRRWLCEIPNDYQHAIEISHAQVSATEEGQLPKEFAHKTPSQSALAMNAFH